jgi:pimeloyl-[acyl-carrier protein] methyl ester esterase
VALRWAAREPDKVRRLILVNSTPCFTGRADWDFGMEAEVLEKFAAELEQNHAATLRRFIALQLRGSENERELLALMRERLFSRGEPDIDALRCGLGILRDTDLRAELPNIRQPTLAIAGERDRLTPPQASHYLAQILPAGCVVEIAGRRTRRSYRIPSLLWNRSGDSCMNELELVLWCACASRQWCVNAPYDDVWVKMNEFGK